MFLFRPRHRFDSIVALIALTFIVQVFISYRLWEPSLRRFPIVPLWEGLPLDFGKTIGFALFGLLVAFSGLLIVLRDKRPAILGWLLLVGLLVLQDILRLQAWVYQYSLFLGVGYFYYKNAEKYAAAVWTCWRILFIATYFWAGIHKINPHFATDVMGWWMGIFKTTEKLGDYPAVGYAVAIGEALLAVGLILPRLRRPALWGLLALHTTILVFLIADGWNSVVYPWNGLMVFVGWLLFTQEPEQTEQSLAPRRFAPTAVYLFLGGFAPLLHLGGYWPYNLSFTMYSGLAFEGYVVINDEGGGDCIPRKLWIELAPYNMTQSSLLLDDWSMWELNVPTFPEEGVLYRTAQRLCPCTAQYGGAVAFERTYRTQREKKTWEMPCEVVK